MKIVCRQISVFGWGVAICEMRHRDVRNMRAEVRGDVCVFVV